MASKFRSCFFLAIFAFALTSVVHGKDGDRIIKFYQSLCQQFSVLDCNTCPDTCSAVFVYDCKGHYHQKYHFKLHIFEPPESCPTEKCPEDYGEKIYEGDPFRVIEEYLRPSFVECSSIA